MEYLESEKEKKDIEDLIKKLSYCELEYQQNGYLSVGKFNAIKQSIQVIKKQQKEIKELKILLQKNNKYTHELEKDLFENCNNYVVDKDKIREKIKELANKNVEVFGADRYEYAVRVLQELLEEENNEI